MLLSAPQALYQCQNSDRELKLKSSDTEKNLSAQKEKVRVKRLPRRKSKPEVGAYKVPHLCICFVRLNKLIMISSWSSSWSKNITHFRFLLWTVTIIIIFLCIYSLFWVAVPWVAGQTKYLHLNYNSPDRFGKNHVKPCDPIIMHPYSCLDTKLVTFTQGKRSNSQISASYFLPNFIRTVLTRGGDSYLYWFDARCLSCCSPFSK